MNTLTYCLVLREFYCQQHHEENNQPAVSPRFTFLTCIHYVCVCFLSLCLCYKQLDTHPESSWIILSLSCFIFKTERENKMTCTRLPVTFPLLLQFCLEMRVVLIFFMKPCLSGFVWIVFHFSFSPSRQSWRAKSVVWSVLWWTLWHCEVLKKELKFVVSSSSSPRTGAGASGGLKLEQLQLLRLSTAGSSVDLPALWSVVVKLGEMENCCTSFFFSPSGF